MDILSLLSSRKNPIVLDIGSAVTKCGYAGDAEPRLLPTEFVTTSGKRLKWSDLCRAQVPSYVEAEWEDAIFNFLYKVFFETLLANPKEYRVIYCENIVGSSVLRRMMGAVMFRKFEVPGIVVVPAQPLAIFPTQETTALIIDCGFYDTTVVPVAQRIVLSHAHRTVAIGARAVYAKMSQLLSTYPSVYTTSSASDTNTSHNNAPVPYDSEANQNEEDAEGEGAPEENPASQWCRTLSTMLRSGGVVLRRGTSPIATGTTMTNWSPPSSLSKQTYRIDHGAIWQQAPLALFDTDDEGHSLASVILDSLLKCHVDVRQSLARKLLFVGGITSLPGFQARVFQEIQYLLSSENQRSGARYESLRGLAGQFDIIKTPFKPQILPWVGGSIVASVESAIKDEEVSRDKFLATNALPDWTCLLDRESRLRLLKSADTEQDLLVY